MTDPKQPPSEITLSQPITYRDQKVTSLRFRRPKAGDLEAMGDFKNETTQVLVLLERLTGVGIEALRELDAADLEQASRAVAGFLP